MSEVVLEHFPEFEAKIRGLVAELRGAGSRRATLAGAQVFEGGMKIRARQAGIWDTGALVGGIVSKNLSDTEAVASVTAEYGVYNEYGTGIYAEGGGGRKTPWSYFNPRAGHVITTRGMHARPFVRPTFDQDKGDAADAVVESLRETAEAAL